MRKISHWNPLVQRLREALRLRARWLTAVALQLESGRSWLGRFVSTVASWDSSEVMVGSDLIVTPEDTQTVTTKLSVTIFPCASNSSLQRMCFEGDFKWFITRAILHYPKSCSPFFLTLLPHLKVNFRNAHMYPSPDQLGGTCAWGIWIAKLKHVWKLI